MRTRDLDFVLLPLTRDGRPADPASLDTLAARLPAVTDCFATAIVIWRPRADMIERSVISFIRADIEQEQCPTLREDRTSQNSMRGRGPVRMSENRHGRRRDDRVR